MQAARSLSIARPALVVPALFIATVFLSASLLFFVQPLFTKLVLPRIGGSPAVWTTAMLFFQTVLIAGYLYAHMLTRHLPVRGQVWVHLGVWGLALICLPLAIPDWWHFDVTAAPAWQTLVLFAAGVGLPFFALSANAPLIQFWYGRSGGPSSHDPYFLYGASNLGSLMALLGFPLLAEQIFGASRIGLGWAAGFIALGGFLLVAGFCARGPAKVIEKPLGKLGNLEKIRTGQIAYWAFLAFVPSSLMLALTTKISIDLGSFPLIWVLPLALYLLSFVISFSGRRLISDWALRIVTGMALLVMLVKFLGLHGNYLTWGEVGLLLSCFLAVAIYAHRRLYDARPDAAHLTMFYLTMSVGGALGGLFNSIIAPMLFAGVYEAAITVILATVLLFRATGRKKRTLPAALLRGATMGFVVAIPAILAGHGFAEDAWRAVMLLLITGALLAGVRLRRDGAACYAATVVLALTAWLHLPDDALLRDRSFFGTHVVYEDEGLRKYGNGTTLHGAQRISDDTAARPTPLFYYHPNGPMAQVLTSERGRAARAIGIVGLGVGSLACYRQPGQSWQFYEIDPIVDAIARNPAHYRFLSACTPDAPTHLGDARVVLTAQEDVTYDILVIDAYSSDAVPVHLTTNQAIELYMDRLTPDGILIFHISNRYYAIDRPLGRSAADLGLVGRIQTYKGHADQDPGDTASVAVTLTRTPDALGDLAGDPRWTALENDGGRVWTDDYANLLSIMR